MATTKTKTELTRLAWITALRREGHRQCEGDYFCGTQVCALGLLVEAAGLERSWISMRSRGYADIGELADLLPSQSEMVWRLNDGKKMCRADPILRKHTFAEIADIVEGWFAPA